MSVCIIIACSLVPRPIPSVCSHAIQHLSLAVLRPEKIWVNYQHDHQLWDCQTFVCNSVRELSGIIILSLRHVLPQAYQAGSVWGVSDADLPQGSYSAMQSDKMAEDKRLPSSGRKMVKLFVIGSSVNRISHFFIGCPKQSCSFSIIKHV